MNFDDLTPIFLTNTRFTGVCINPMSDNFVMNRQLIANWTTKKKVMVEAALLKVVKQQQEAKAEKKEEE